jgi:hypothetical protein
MNYDPRPHPPYAFHYLLGVLFHHLAPEAVNTLPKVLPSTLRWHGKRAPLYPTCGLHIVFRFFDFTLIASNLPGSVAYLGPLGYLRKHSVAASTASHLLFFNQKSC